MEGGEGSSLLFSEDLRPSSLLLCIITGCCSAATESDANVSNVRRENKLYSYKEQMADIELRRVCICLRQVVLIQGTDGRH